MRGHSDPSLIYKYAIFTEIRLYSVSLVPIETNKFRTKYGVTWTPHVPSRVKEN